MHERIYKHICKECETVFYVENLKLLSACHCPVSDCHNRGIYVDEYKTESDVKVWERDASLLVIELENETAVPKVFYEGKEITQKVKVSFDWETKGCDFNSGGTQLNIEHIETHEEPVFKGINLCRGKYTHDQH